MSRTITALFDTRADADAAKARLSQSSIDASGISITDQSSAGALSSGYSSHEDRGFWASLKDTFLPTEDRHAYEEGVRRGGFLLTATVAEDQADTAVDILDNANSVDIDGRADDWRAGGWDYKAPVEPVAGAYAKAPVTDNANEERIAVVEETLKVGKREVNRGGVRVRSYVVETPVSEQVSLRDEHVSVDRRPVTNGTVPADAFRERTIEMTETAEEAVIAKDARVVEEVVVRKDVDNRTETVSDTVRSTKVDVEREPGLTDTTRTGTTAAGVTSATASLGDKIAGLAKEGAGKVTGNESLERKGEMQQGKTPGSKY